ncbi:MAG: M28 family peptidase [Salinirussus sp.]
MWIAEAFESGVGWAHLQTLVDVDGGTGNRMSGSRGEREAAIATRDALGDVGARDARLESFDLTGWQRGSSRITADGLDHDCIALPRSPADEVSGPLVDVGYGLPDDFGPQCDGGVVLARSDAPDWYDRYIHRREKYYRAIDAGAVGFIYRNHVPGQLPPTGSVGSGDDPIGPIPAVGVSREVGARLARRFEADPVTVSVEADHWPPDGASDRTTSHNVRAEIGPIDAPRVLLTSHVDAHDIAEGAIDNGFGTATLIAVANALREREATLDATIEFVAFGAEEVGLVGSSRFAASESLDDVVAAINLDFLGRGRTLHVSTSGFSELAEGAEAAGERFDHPIETSPVVNTHSDHWPFVQRGLPACMVGHATDDDGRGWGHTAADTLDKVEARTLAETAILVTEFVATIADGPVETSRRDPAEIADALEEQNDAEGMRIAGDWPFE